jgi:hypothetical protein
VKGAFDADQALTGHKTEAVQRRYSTVAESDLREGAAKLAVLHPEGRQADVPPTHIRGLPGKDAQRLRIRVPSGRAERPGLNRHSGPARSGASTTGYRMVEAVVSGFTTSR